MIEKASAKRQRVGPTDALRMARNADRVVAVRRGAVVSFDMLRKPPDRVTLIEHLLGPTGNLRAPALRIGGTLLVGYHESMYERFVKSN